MSLKSSAQERTGAQYHRILTETSPSESSSLIIIDSSYVQALIGPLFSEDRLGALYSSILPAMPSAIFPLNNLG
mgnify:CR=1 FL=1